MRVTSRHLLKKQRKNMTEKLERAQRSTPLAPNPPPSRPPESSAPPNSLRPRMRFVCKLQPDPPLMCGSAEDTVSSSPDFRLRIDADLFQGAPLYVLALEVPSMVAALRELATFCAVTAAESDVEESQYAAELIEVITPIASTARVLPALAAWTASATLRLHTQIQGSDGLEPCVLMCMDFEVHDLGSEQARIETDAPIQGWYEEIAILGALDGFRGDAADLLERLDMHMNSGATLARAHLFDGTVRRAQQALLSLYTDDPTIQRQVDEFSTWLIQMHNDKSMRRGFSEENVETAAGGRLH